MRATLVSGDDDLEQILALQRANLASALSPDDVLSQGFVTVEHTLASLQRMHALAPSVIVREGDELAGYALVMPLETAELFPVLHTMFANFARLTWRGRPLSAHRYYVMGQVCVARPWRGRGVFDALYAGHREAYASRYDFTITEIAVRNTRSMRAHQRIGFEILDTYRDTTDTWAVVAWGF